MKIQCDVCSRDEASVFCCADEAALCSACDRRVHRANKLAGKHRRLSLLLPSSTASSSSLAHPLCDICQEKRGFLFCKEDRAILCKDCDIPIHAANDLTMKHSRFILTGARLSAAPIPSSSSELEAPAVDESAAAGGGGSGRSISEYLIKMLPGWRVEDLLVDDSELLPFPEANLESGWPGAAAAEELNMWVPHVPQIPPPHHPAGAGDAVFRQGFLPKEASHPIHLNRDQRIDDAFTVPQITPASGNNKRSRILSGFF